MVALADKQGVAPFLTALNGSQLKSRIIMMKKNTKNKYAWLKQLVVLPLLAVLVMGLSNREIKTEIKHLNESTPTHIETQKETTVYDQTTYGNNEHLEDIIISNKDKQIEPVSDAKDNYKIRSDNEQETMILSENVRITQEPDTNVSKKTDKRFSLDNRLYIIDGKEYKGDINDIDVNDIESISVLKGESGLKHYGEKGKNGVVLFATKSGNNPNQDGIATKMSALTKKNQELNKFLISIEFQENQLILEGLEGCAFTNVKFSIADNKPVAINQFGMASARTVNSADNSDFLFEIEKINDQIKLTGIKGTAWKELSYKPAIQKNLVSETGVSKANNPLIVIDGIVTGFKSVDHINPADIQSVTILKDEKAAEKYGVKGKDGVIEITMKPVGIYTKLQLRRFIADEIRYPVLAHKSNLEKTVNLSLKIDTEGKISAITEESLTTDFTLDEVVVVGYKNQDTEVTGYGSKSAAAEAQKVKEQLFEDETKRVIRKISKLDSDKFKGKTVGITVKFILQ
jgi:hypothetical protein